MVGSGRRVKFLAEGFDLRGDGSNRHSGSEASIGSVVVVIVSSILGHYVGVIGWWGVWTLDGLC